MMLLPLLLALGSFQEKGPDPKDALRTQWKPVTLALTDTPARDVLDQIFQQTGEKLRIADDWNPKPISVNFKNATFWEAVDEVCRLDGNLAFGERGRVGLVAGTPATPPTAYVGPLRFSIREVTRVREIHYPERKDRTEVFLHARWTSGYRPIRDPWPWPGAIEIVRAEDGRGRSLLPVVEVDTSFVRSAGGSPDGESTWLLRLQPLDRAENSIARLDLVWKTLQPDDIEGVVFDTPLQSEGVRRRTGDFSVTLESCKKDTKGGSMMELKLVLEADPSNLSPESRRSLEAIPLARRLLQEMEVDGASKWPYWTPAADPKNPLKVTLGTWLDGGAPPQSMKVYVARRMTLLPVPMSFSGIRVPEVGK